MEIKFNSLGSARTPVNGGMSYKNKTARTPAVVMILGIYIFLIVGRVPDYFPALHLGLVAPITAAGAGLLSMKGNRSGPFRLPETRAVVALLCLSIVAIPFS